MRVLALVLQACAMLMLPSLADAQPTAGKWQTLGTLNLSNAQAVATLHLEANSNRTTSIRLLSEANAVRVRQIDISYATGRIDYISGPFDLKPGIPSAPIAERKQSQVVAGVTLHLAEGGSGPVQLALSGLVVG